MMDPLLMASQVASADKEDPGKGPNLKLPEGCSSPRAAGYWDSLFSGDLCCKLWFTVPRCTSRKLVARLTDLLRTAVVDQRHDVNAHIPQDVLRGIAGHTRDKVCIANHKAFWPHPPTLLYLFGDMKVYGGAQRMGDMVVQNSSQLHWGVNLAPGVKAESSNCAGSDFMSFCPDCSDGLYCGVEGDLLKKIFHRARKEYWARRKVRAWKKKSLCWGYHGCGCIRPRALGFAENSPDDISNSEPTKHLPEGVPHNTSSKLNGARHPKRSSTDGLDARGRGLGWGRAFDWKGIFEKYNVNMCFDKWNSLEWLPNTDSFRPSSLESLLEDEAFEANGHKLDAASGHTGGGKAERRKLWEHDPDASCIRIIRSASPERLKRSRVCVEVDCSTAGALKNGTGKKYLGKEDAPVAGDGHCRVPLATGSMEPVSCLSLPAGDREGNNDDYVATVEFQRMWPVFLRVSREDHIPVGVSNSGGGEILFLGCILDAFHMRLKTQGDISTCLSAIADVTKADSSDGNHRTHLRPNESHSEAKGSSKEPLLPYNCPDVFSQAESGVGNSSQTQLAAAGPAHGCVEEPPSDHLKSSLKSLPGILFEPAPSPGLRGSSSGVSEGSRPNDIAVTLPSASKGDGGREERFAATGRRLPKAGCVVEPDGECEEQCIMRCAKSALERFALLFSASSGLADLALPASTLAADIQPREASPRPACCASLDHMPSACHGGLSKSKDSSPARQRKFELAVEWPPVAQQPRHKRSEVPRTGSVVQGTCAKPDDSDPEPGQVPGGDEDRHRRGSQRETRFSETSGAPPLSRTDVSHWRQSGTAAPSTCFPVEAGGFSERFSPKRFHSSSVEMQRKRLLPSGCQGAWSLYEAEIVRQPVQEHRVCGGPQPLGPPAAARSASSTVFGRRRECQHPYAWLQPSDPPLASDAAQDPYANMDESDESSPNIIRLSWRGALGPGNSSFAGPTAPCMGSCPAALSHLGPAARGQQHGPSSPASSGCGSLPVPPDIAVANRSVKVHEGTDTACPARQTEHPTRRPVFVASVAPQEAAGLAHHSKVFDEGRRYIDCAAAQSLDDFHSHIDGDAEQGNASQSPERAIEPSGVGKGGTTLQAAECRCPDGMAFKTSCVPATGFVNASSNGVLSESKFNIGLALQGISNHACGLNRDTSKWPGTATLFSDTQLVNNSKSLQTGYGTYLRERLEAVISGVWCWRSDSVSDFSTSYHDKPFSTDVTQDAIRSGFTPYLLMHYASTTRLEKALQHLDMSVCGRRNIPFHGFSEELVDSFCSGVGHGMMYYSAVPGSVFPIHCEQGGLGAFNMIVGALAAYIEGLQA